MDQLLRLSEAGIPCAIISGNHSTPRLRETGSVFRVFEHVPGLHLAYTGRLEAFEFGDLKVHAVPHCADQALFDEALSELRPDKEFGTNIAILHCGVETIDVFRMGEFNELMARQSAFERGFDYVALGHYHEHCDVAENAAYAGSTERLGFGEAGQPKGFVALDTDTGKRKFRELSVRPMLDMRPIDCKGMGSVEIRKAVADSLASVELAGAIVRQRMTNVEKRELNLLDISGLRALASEALHFELRPSVVDAGQAIAARDAAFESLEREFVSYIAQVALEGVDPKELERKGLMYLSRGGVRE
jgi:DNA repair exonuclease SbcCD nuclease subunit